MPPPHDDLKIIIKKNGEVWVQGPNLSPQRLQHYRQLFEDILGNAQIVSTSGDLPPAPTFTSTGQETEEQDQQTREDKQIKQKQ